MKESFRRNAAAAPADGSPDDTVAHGTTFSVTLFKG